jgi:GntR family transcriptional regulator of gluconate operon
MSRPRKQRVDPDVALTAPGLARRELWEGVADALRGAILAGSIRAGASLVEADLAGRFDVSRGPIRDALRELAREGLVVDLPRRGTVVSTLSFTDIQEVYEVREGLEIEAARLAVERASSVDIASLAGRVAALEAAWARGAEYAESLAADLAFHRDLVALSGNRRLISTYDQMLVQTQLNAITAAELNPRLRRGQRRSAHRDIVRGLKARDADAAGRAVAEHYTYARERLFEGIRPRSEPRLR